MSWDGYIEHLMVDLPNTGGKLTSSAIVGQDGGVWAQSEAFPAVTPEQVAALMTGFASLEKDGHAGELGGKGIFLGDQKFQVVPGDETVMRGKSTGGGCCIKKTNTALVIGIYNEPVQPGECNVVVENLGDYLSGQQCAGSIKYVHQSCLLHWLEHSGNTHCEVCKHEFKFTPIYRDDAPLKLPWHELAAGLVKRAAAAARVAHRVWVVSCVWLVLVPWVTCAVWRLCFLRSLADAPRLLRERSHVLAVATDCVSGSLLCIAVVLLNVGLSALKEQLKAALAGLEQQLAPAPAAPPAAGGDAAGPAAAPAEGGGGGDGDAGDAGDAGEAQPLLQPERAQGQPPLDAHGAAVALAVLAPAIMIDAIVGEAAEPAAGGGPREGDAFADVPVEELLGLQGSWLAFAETVALVLVGNALAMLALVLLPLALGRALLTAAAAAAAALSPAQLVALQAALRRHPAMHRLLGVALAVLAGMPPAGDEAPAGGAAAAAAAATAGSGGSADAVLQLAAAEALPLMPVSLEQLLHELSAQLELPARADVVALSAGHALLAALLATAVWAFLSVRLWRVASARVRRAGGRRPLLQVLRSSARWCLAAAGLAARGAKVALLLALEFVAAPLAAGLWVDVCALPLTAHSVGARGEALAAAPLIAGFLHWVLGVGCLLGAAFVLVVLRDTLRAGALPRLQELAAGERNPFADMLREPLPRYLGRVAATWAVGACLCVVLVHVPALAARALAPALWPLRVGLFDPVTQVPADMLLLHILAPLTLEHVRVREGLKAALRWWLAWAGGLLGWRDYLLEPQPQREQPQREQQQREQPFDAGAAAAGAGAAAAEQAAEAAAAATTAAAATAAGGAAAGQQATTPQAAGATSGIGSSTSSDGAAAPSSSAAAAAAAPPPPGEAHRALPQPQLDEQRARQPPPPPPAPAPAPSTEWFEAQPSYAAKVVGLALLWLASAAAANTALLIVPVALGRGLLRAARLPFQSDLLTGAIGLVALWAGAALARGAAASAGANARALASAVGRWLLLAGQCALLLVLWLGVVATLLGMLCELVLLPLRLPPNQTALIFLYQDWVLGVLALKLWHVLAALGAPRRGGAPPRVNADAWHAHAEAVAAAGLAGLDFRRALTKVVGPVLLRLCTSLALPYVLARGLLPALLPRLPAAALRAAQLYAHAAFHAALLAWCGAARAARAGAALHAAIRDDRYLVGRRLANCAAGAAAEGEAGAAGGAAEEAEEEAGGAAAGAGADEAGGGGAGG
ncbi:SUD1 [Scenedesmus sp. PABB004]|nr:SUD1 [Scenedesmus sp. PABB004]